MAKTITMKDIAKKLNVSKVTVSKALGDKDGVSEELKQRIKELAEEMGYRYNISAQTIKSGLSYNVGVIVSERFTGDQRSFYLVMYQYLTKALDMHRYSSIFHVLTDDDENNLELPRCYKDRKVDAFIVLGQVSSSYIDLLKKCDVPFVFLDFYDEHTEVDCVVSDNFYGAYEITNYLIQNNHKEIAYVGNIHSTSSIQDRFLGYYKSLIEHKIKFNEDYLIADRDDKGKLYDFPLPEKMPTAFVCNCDRVAYRLIQRLQEMGYKVPENISVVGFDNDIFSTLSNPQITTVDVNMIEMTETVADLIVDKINRDKRYGRVLIKGSIVYRDSVSKHM